MKVINSLLFSLILSISLYGQKQYPLITLETTEGIIKILLYDETPLHSENFIKLVNEGYYNNQLFHRVIKNFIIQTGDPKSINAQPGAMLGTRGPGYTIPAEFNPKYYHKKGAIASARMGDNVNPRKESSGSQLYIVVGQIFSPDQLNTFVNNGSHIPFTPEQTQEYTTLGGTPHLDYNYTVFGELIEGFEIINRISNAQTDLNDRPLTDIKIIKAHTVKN